MSSTKATQTRASAGPDAIVIEHAYADRHSTLELADGADRLERIRVTPIGPEHWRGARVYLQPSVRSASMCLSLEPGEARELAAMLTAVADVADELDIPADEDCGLSSR